MSAWDNEGPVEPTGWGADFVEAPVNGGFDAGAFSAGAPPATNGRASGSDGGYGGGSDSGDAANGEPRDNACRYCKQEGHFARECPAKPEGAGACFNCGEQGHNKADCPNPRVFTGTCRHCEKTGHPAKECPDKPADICRQCKQEGHLLKDCTNNRVIDNSHIADRSADDAWTDMMEASKKNEFEDFKEHLMEYLKAHQTMGVPVCLADIEQSFRDCAIRYFLQALSAEVTYDKVIIGPNGETKDREFLWSLHKGAKPRRSRAVGNRIAATPEENLERLKKAGTLEDELGPFCHTCRDKGHSRKDCEVERVDDEMDTKVVLKCSNCESSTHRLRDCPEPRKVISRGCRNCGEEGHKASECEKPRMADENTECRKCNQMGHFSRDCPNAPKQICFNCYEEGHRSSDCTNEKVMKCRNCDAIGHSSRECDKPMDITRVKCRECDQLGHFANKCPEKNRNVEEGCAFGGYGGGAQEPNDCDYSAPAPSAVPEKIGTWGGADTAAVADPVGTWATNVAEQTVGGW